jgi:hypothetical protein
MSKAIRHLVGLDLGQPQDSTALAVLTQQGGGSRSHYAVRHLHRWPPGTPYPHIAENVVKLLQTSELRTCRLVVDQTGVGKAVVGLLRPGSSVSMRRVVLTAGHAVTQDEDGSWRVPKKEVVSVLQVLLQTQRLKVAAGLPLAQTLTLEMASFRAAVAETNDDSVSWREREHDDLVLAVAIAAWQGERTPAITGEPMVLGHRGGVTWWR